MTGLVIDGLKKVFSESRGSEIVAVEDLSIDIKDGEFLVLVGPSGCGKSTTLRMIAGLESLTEGAIRLGNEQLHNSQPQDRDIAMVFQSYALYPHMTVQGNMSFGLEESTDMSSDEIQGRVGETAEMMDIDDYLDRKPGELSGGQQQRVALGRAIVRDPEVFLLDEPLSNLDAKLRASMRTELQRLQEDLGVTTVYVTHDQTEAMTMGDRIAILNDGHLQQIGTPLECYHEPANRFVAGFIGEPSMNFFDMEAQGSRLVGENFAYPISDELREAIGDTTYVTLGVRPEDIELVSKQENNHDFQTIVDVVEPVGSGNNVYLAFGDQSDTETGDPERPAMDIDTQQTFVATIGGLRRVEEGQPAIARIPDEAIHLFDTESGDTLKNRAIESMNGIEPQI